MGAVVRDAGDGTYDVTFTVSELMVGDFSVSIGEITGEMTSPNQSSAAGAAAGPAANAAANAAAGVARMVHGISGSPVVIRTTGMGLMALRQDDEWEESETGTRV